ncbi:MAG: VWA domain-containing protein, partial [Planctomycetota bacterium]
MMFEQLSKQPHSNRYESIADNPFVSVQSAPRSTFSIDVDTASYGIVRSYITRQGRLPPPSAVRLEELINYFEYPRPQQFDTPVDDAGQKVVVDAPFHTQIELTRCPWQPKNHLARISVFGKDVDRDQRPPCNLVFLVDVSGSMDQPNKLPLVRHGLQTLIGQLHGRDRVGIVTYAGNAGVHLPSTSMDDHQRIRSSISQLVSGGGTNGAAGIQMAYEMAMQHRIPGGINRVILCTDGDFNVGTTNTEELVAMVSQHSKSGTFLSVFGFGMDNHNDAMMERISGEGNGTYGFIDTQNESDRVFRKQCTTTLMTIAKDVKLQVEFNPAQVAAYRLLGYENRRLADRDFNDDTKDAGEIGAGHTVTALYELQLQSAVADNVASLDPLRYQPMDKKNGDEKDIVEVLDGDEVVNGDASVDQASPTPAVPSAVYGELMAMKIRYKDPEGENSRVLLYPVPVPSNAEALGEPSPTTRLAVAAAGFG